MNVETMRDFFCRCMIVNSGVYAATALATLLIAAFNFAPYIIA